MEEITKMQALIEELRELLEGFDLTVHDDEGNADYIYKATAGLDQVEGAVGDLVV